ncbi:MAG TPA: hypothetical protein VIG38_06920 [Hyphomicrobium sp.]
MASESRTARPPFRRFDGRATSKTLEKGVNPPDIRGPSAALPRPGEARIQKISIFFLETPGSRRRSGEIASDEKSKLVNMSEEELTSLKDHTGAFSECHDACADGCVDTCEAEREARRHAEHKVRKCLICRDPFPSAWAGERVCRKCKSTSTWRSSGME